MRLFLEGIKRRFWRKNLKDLEKDSDSTVEEVSLLDPFLQRWKSLFTRRLARPLMIAGKR